MKQKYEINAQEADAAADFAVGLLLNLDRSVVERELKRNQGKWRRDVSISPPYHALGLMKVGILGFGRVGKKVAERLRPFGSDLLVYDPGADKADLRSYGCQPADFNTLFQESDAVTLHACLSEESRYVIGREQFALMKPTAWFINITQAELVEEAALIDAVVHQKIAGAALDVFRQEPLPKEYPLIGLPNVILTPHIASGTGVRTSCGV